MRPSDASEAARRERPVPAGPEGVAPGEEPAPAEVEETLPASRPGAGAGDDRWIPEAAFDAY